MTRIITHMSRRLRQRQGASIQTQYVQPFIEKFFRRENATIEQINAVLKALTPLFLRFGVYYSSKVVRTLEL
jgi:hypothetical protein